MAQPFILRVSDNVDTVNFLGYPYYVLDGGFDISMPQVRREFAQERPGFFVPIITDYEYRECRLKFEIRGLTRTEILSYLHKLTRILKNIHARSTLSSGRRGELSYAWEGSTNITYFEVYGGDVRFPDDILSVAKIHLTSDGKYVLPDIELTLFLSGPGYGVSIFSDTLVEVPLYNPSVGANQTGGVVIENPWSGKTGVTPYWWVEIDGDDLPGDLPLITRIELASSSAGATYTNWSSIYMGLHTSPFPSSLVFDGSDAAWTPWSSVSSVYANKGNFLDFNFTTGQTPGSLNPDVGWGLNNNTVGTFMAFMHVENFGSISNIYDRMAFTLGLGSASNTWGIYYQGDWVQAPNGSQASIPLGSITLPPFGRDLSNVGTLDGNLWVGLWAAAEASTRVNFDFLSLLPITNGLRIWKNRLDASAAAAGVTGTLKDDGWRGLQYIVKSGSLLASPFYGVLSPLKLDPGLDQRIYFTSSGLQGSTVDLREFRRSFTARVYVVPTYLTLAL